MSRRTPWVVVLAAAGPLKRGRGRNHVPWSGPAASLRVPVTPENRAVLRALRAAELDAWHRATPAIPL